MLRYCAVCAHPDLEAIDFALMGEAASGETRLNVLVALSMALIDGELVPPPNSRLRLYTLLDGLDTEGVFDGSTGAAVGVSVQ